MIPLVALLLGFMAAATAVWLIVQLLQDSVVAMAALLAVAIVTYGAGPEVARLVSQAPVEVTVVG
jgi:cobalamin synthase